MQLLALCAWQSDINHEQVLCLVQPVLKNPNTEPGRIRGETRVTGATEYFRHSCHQ